MFIMGLIGKRQLKQGKKKVSLRKGIWFVFLATWLHAICFLIDQSRRGLKAENLTTHKCYKKTNDLISKSQRRTMVV